MITFLWLFGLIGMAGSILRVIPAWVWAVLGLWWLGGKLLAAL